MDPVYGFSLQWKCRWPTEDSQHSSGLKSGQCSRRRRSNFWPHSGPICFQVWNMNGTWLEWKVEAKWEAVKVEKSRMDRSLYQSVVVDKSLTHCKCKWTCNIVNEAHFPIQFAPKLNQNAVTRLIPTSKRRITSSRLKDLVFVILRSEESSSSLLTSPGMPGITIVTRPPHPLKRTV